MWIHLSALALTLAIALNLVAPWREECRCRPYESCWPSPSDWNALNGTLDGRLVALKPSGHDCVPDGQDSKNCQELVSNFHNTTWRVQNPATLQVVNWEYSRLRKEACHVDADGIVESCGQGRVPLFSASVQSVSQVQAVVRFAVTHNLRLAIRNTGHDLAGRSTSPDSLQLLTSALNGYQFTDAFHPTAPWGQQVPSEGPAVTVGAGITTGELYTAAENAGYTVVGGSCSTVGIAGGWMQGGGYGILSPSKGLGVDNVLEFSMVAANGAHVIANKYQNKELFWAVRGGGGGTFGVVTSVTFRLHPDVAATVATMDIVFPDGADEKFWLAIKEHLAVLEKLIGLGIAVQTFAMPIFPMGGAFLKIEVYLTGDQSNQTGNQNMLDHLARLQELGLQVAYSEEHVEKLSAYLAQPRGMDQAGASILTASRLISKDLLSSHMGPDQVAETLHRLEFHPGDVLSFEGMVGRQAMGTDHLVDNALHPDWKKALISLTLGRALPPSPNWKVYEQIEQELSETQVPLLQSIDSAVGGAGYLGVPFAYERDPVMTYWGSNYARLLSIKHLWDPMGLFITRLGVGSEDWDDEGMCRASSTYMMIPSFLNDCFRRMAVALWELCT
ncbi:FAD-linked oxidoreductase [Penicillium hetheringtonii]|uniref:FAD-linked oxidoreductase n=1 Tax=Penicillium hetheringtonii TaxID=911720 RepID=A0AAD6DNH4_9EURO|nr:FAD-linked oxidoreductase [Penicillium hetheringtonii]